MLYYIYFVTNITFFYENLLGAVKIVTPQQHTILQSPTQIQKVDM